MSVDLISRQAAIDILCYPCSRHMLGHKCTECGAVQEMMALPSAERHGRWIRTHNPIGQEITVCSVCGKIKQQAYPYYCGNCGASMVNEDE